MMNENRGNPKVAIKVKTFWIPQAETHVAHIWLEILLCSTVMALLWITVNPLA